jgi:NAD(P)-dependent dehydrogenase (short-subunit alcohol dehydrogenase family)
MKKIDGLVNNAGVRQRKKFNNITKFDLDYIIENNLKSVFKLSQLFSSMMKKKSSSIVNISSIVGPRGFKDLSGYAMTKSGIIGLSKSLAVELANKNIRVNTICPGFIKSSYANSFQKKLPKVYKFTLERTPLKRWGTCNEVANLIIFMLSDESSYITGNTIYIDGGWTSH